MRNPLIIAAGLLAASVFTPTIAYSASCDRVAYCWTLETIKDNRGCDVCPPRPQSNRIVYLPAEFTSWSDENWRAVSDYCAIPRYKHQACDRYRELTSWCAGRDVPESHKAACEYHGLPVYEEPPPPVAEVANAVNQCMGVFGKVKLGLVVPLREAKRLPPRVERTVTKARKLKDALEKMSMVYRLYRDRERVQNDLKQYLELIENPQLVGLFLGAAISNTGEAACIHDHNEKTRGNIDAIVTCFGEVAKQRTVIQDVQRAHFILEKLNETEIDRCFDAAGKAALKVKASR